jgi:hypothetical protein
MVQSFSRKDQEPPMDLEENDLEIAPTKSIVFREIDTSSTTKYPAPPRKRKKHDRSSRPRGSKRLRQGSQSRTKDSASRQDENRKEHTNSVHCSMEACNQGGKDAAGLPAQSPECFSKHDAPISSSLPQIITSGNPET